MNARRKAEKRPTRPIHFVFAVFLLGIFGVLCWQIFQVVTTPPTIETATPAKMKQTKAEPKKPDINTAQIQTLKKLQVVDPKSLGGDANKVYFRDSSGLIYCEINKVLANTKDNKWLDQYVKDGSVPKGAGVLCNLIRSGKPHEQDVQSCPKGVRYSGGVAALWDTGVGYGICKDVHQLVLVIDAHHPIKGNETKAMSSAKQLPIGNSVRFGDYICGMPRDKMMCVNATNGRGFAVGITDYETFGASGE